jgi:hypothetical protein
MGGISVADAARLLNTRGGWRLASGVVVDVTIKDVVTGMWNRTEYLIEPVAGTGQVWVSSGKVKVAENY